MSQMGVLVEDKELFISLRFKFSEEPFLEEGPSILQALNPPGDFGERDTN